VAAPKRAKVRPGKPAPLAAFVADCHIGNHARHGGPLIDGLNRRGRESVAALRRAVQLAKERRCWAFVVCGDLFHVPRPEPAIIRAVQDVFREADPMKVLLIPGNHDMPDATATSGNTAMAPLFDPAVVGANVDVVREARWIHYPGVSVMAIPFWGADPMSAHVAATMEHLTDPERDGRDQHGAPGTKSLEGADPIRVAAIHVGLWDGDDAAPWQRKARDGMEGEALLNLMRQGKIDVSFVGNYHEHRMWIGGADSPKHPKRLACQVGTLAPHGHGDGGVLGRGLMGFLEHDGEVTMALVPGPRFVTVVDPKELPAGGEDGFAYYVRARGAAAAAFRGKDLAALGIYAAFEIEAEAPSVEAELDAAEGRRAPRAETDEGAIEGFVGGMVLPDGLDRAKVLDLALDCWKRA